MGRAAPLTCLVFAMAASCHESGAPPAPPPLPTPTVTASAPDEPPAPIVFVDPPPPDPCEGKGPGTLAAHDEPVKEDLTPTPESVERALRDIAAAHPCRTELVEIAKSHFGRPVLALLVHDRSKPSRDGVPSFLFTGSTHGDEPLSTSIALDQARWLLSSDARAKRLVSEARTWIVPLVNPDGLALYRSLPKHWAKTGQVKSPGRKNGRDHDGDGKHALNEGVDLNRNFPFRWGALGEGGSTSGKYLRSYRGPSAASEPETQAIVALAGREHFAASISLHVGTAAILVPYTTDGVKDPEPNELFAIARAMSNAMPHHPDSPPKQPMVVQRNLYTVDGTDQDYFRHEHGTAAYLIEAALRGSDAMPKAAEVVKSVRASLPWLELRLLDGPSVRGTVTGSDGQPIAAEVIVDGVKLRAAEKWTARCKDGGFARYLGAAGKVKVRAVLPDGTTVEQEVTTTATKGAEVALRIPKAFGPPKCGT